jgi:hypothetical protein
VARRLYRKQVINGVYRLDEGALLNDFFGCLQQLGVVDWLGDVRGPAVQREMVPFVPYRLLYSLNTLFGIESMPALPALRCSDEALMRLVGFNAQQVRQGVCQRGAAKRQGPRTRGPICPDALADNLVQLNVRDLEAWFNGVIRALAKAGMLAAKVTASSMPPIWKPRPGMRAAARSPVRERSPTNAARCMRSRSRSMAGS